MQPDQQPERPYEFDVPTAGQPPTSYNYGHGGWPTMSPPAPYLGQHTGTPAPAEPASRRPLWPFITLAVAGIALAAVTGFAFGVNVGESRAAEASPSPSRDPLAPTVEDAKRECMTAFVTEFDQRNAASTTAAATAFRGDTEIREAREVPDGFEVNGTVHYQIASGATKVDAVLELTCTAIPSGAGKLYVQVKNRK